jgi:mannose-6-phosphate isomerase-like protein (cupin superfamily)
MKLAELLGPTLVEQFIARTFGVRAWVQLRNDATAQPLLSLEELDTRVNDGTASLSALAVIGPDGAKLPPEALFVRQPGPAWAPHFLRKSRLGALLRGGHSCVLHNMSQITPRVAELIESVEEAFPGYQADAHIYFSPSAGATGFDVHRDQPQHKFYVQLHGSTHWTVYRGSDPAISMKPDEAAARLAVDFEVRLTPGSVLYLPPGVFHRVESRDGARVSLSIPFYESPLALKVDRTRVPVAELLGESLGAHSNSKSVAE